MRALQVASGCGVRSGYAMAQEGFIISAAAVSPENTAGKANVRKMRFEPVATLGWFGIGPFRRHFRRPHNPPEPVGRTPETVAARDRS
jgi:hypothetical protein